MSIGARTHPWKPLGDGATPIWDALITNWLATHRQDYPGEPAARQKPKAKRVLTPMLDQAVKDFEDKVQTRREA
jgi:hypothetical protein